MRRIMIFRRRWEKTVLVVVSFSKRKIKSLNQSVTCASFVAYLSIIKSKKKKEMNALDLSITFQR